MPRKTAILCPNCRRLVNVDEPVCPYCGAKHPGSRLRFLLSNLGGLRPDNVVSVILYVNIAMYVVSLLLNPSRMGLSPNPLRLLAPSDQSLLLLGATGTVPIDRLHRWWSLLSANYLHGGLLHIFFNMAALHQIGPLVVREYGVPRMIAIYTLGGIGGFLVSYFAGVPFTIGASAAICALIGAMLYYGRHRGGLYGQLMFRQIWGWALGIMLFGFLVPGINNWGHGGGIACGFLLGMILGYQEKSRENSVHRFLAAGCLVATGVVLALSVVSGAAIRFGS